MSALQVSKNLPCRGVLSIFAFSQNSGRQTFRIAETPAIIGFVRD
jgi:hypothetical protein